MTPSPFPWPLPELTPENDAARDFEDLDYDGDAIEFDDEGRVIQASRLGEADSTMPRAGDPSGPPRQGG